MMKNLVIYYIAILAPLGILTWLSKSDLINSTLFVGLLFFYVFVYRTYTDGLRLSEKGIIEKKNIWKKIVPSSNYKYFKELYLN